MRLLIAISFIIGIKVTSVIAGEESQVAREIAEAKLQLRNYQEEAGEETLWRIFLDGEKLGATKLQIAEAGFLLTQFGLTTSNSEYNYLKSWAADAGYLPAMTSLGRDIIYKYENAEDFSDRYKILTEYPEPFSKDDGFFLIIDSAYLGDPDALRHVAGWYKKGKEGFLKNPYEAEEYINKSIEIEIDIGRTKDFHRLIDAARLIRNRDKDIKFSQPLIDEAIDIGSRQPGGIDAHAARKLVRYYATLGENRSELQTDHEYYWRIYLISRLPKALQDNELLSLGDFFSGRFNFLTGEYKEVQSAVVAHAIYNVLNFKRLKLNLHR